MADGKTIITEGKDALGIEFGSTRIKAVLSDLKGNVLGIGTYDWENSLIDGIWTYSLDEIKAGLRGCYGDLKRSLEDQYGVTPTTYGAIGISAMMHGYIALDKDGGQLAPFQTWRNSNTQQAADQLTDLFGFNIPLRWSISHLYQRILDGEDHVGRIGSVSTLAVYVHTLLTGKFVAGVGDASGMFPIDAQTGDYDKVMLDKFENLIRSRNLPWKLTDIFPRVLSAGQDAGTLTEEGAALLDETGALQAGIPLCPPEGDAGTGMVATNSVAPRTGNVSAGTSTFAMLVLEKGLSRLYREIDMVTTPDGYPVAMAHANNGTSDLNAWVGLFKEFCDLFGVKADAGELYGKLYTNSLKGDADCGGIMAYGYYSGEGITHLNEGRPLLVRTPDSTFTLANLMRAHLYSSLGAVKVGMDILLKQEKVKIDKIYGHGGLFKTPGVAQRYLAAALQAPVTVMDTASEGGAWGIALLAAYRICGGGRSLARFLEEEVFSSMTGHTLEASREEIDGFETFIDRYKAAIEAEKAAIASVTW